MKERGGVELEFETMEDRRRSREGFGARPEVHEATRKMREIIETGGVHEMWRVH